MRKFLNCEETGYREINQWKEGCWVDVEIPNDDDFKFMVEDLHVPEDFLEDIADPDERSRTDSEGEWMLTIIRVPFRQDDDNHPYSTIPLGILCNDKNIVTVCYKQTEMINDFILHTQRKSIFITNRFELILRLLFSSTVWFQKYLKQINNKVNAAENELEKSIRNEDLLQLRNLQKALVYFNTSIRGNEVLIGRLESLFQSKNYQNKDLTEDVQIELKQAYNTVNIYSDILTGTMDAFASIISNNVNTIMKRMTSISITLMLPTLIASFYGMNVEVGIDKVPYAFVIIVCFSIALGILAFIIFRKIKWF
ncbi:MAG: magnesium transporter CorA family protein [Phocaeicola sp.]|uniref:magnesium transporter CorA family protein n=1 Tax=Phocaeicola TaxID=909656 RepID=UPI00234E7571|nr:magnesium transporter CorA family protein [Phocaeicola oris]MCE2616930.1 magnesium transporter CorA family protein [Phocaeicola oris]